MVAHLTMRTDGVKQEYRFVEGMHGYIERVVKTDFSSENTYFTSYVRIVKWATI